MRRLSPEAAKELLTGNEEIAFVDVREHGQYGEGHPFFVVNLPYSRLELDVPDLIPRTAVKVLLLDDNDGVAEKAARRLLSIGYDDICLLEGGAPAWKEAGYTLFKGVNLPSKAFGELVEHTMGTPSISVEELEARRRRGDQFIVLDGRSPQEYRGMNIPGAISCPNAELPHRLPMMVTDPNLNVVINCAGRTRSIIGAQSLRNLQPENTVYALKNGTQGWCLSGLELERGTEPAELPELDQAAFAVSRERAAILRSRFSIPQIDSETLARWKADAARTLYVFDVRTAKEYAAGHIATANHAPGGQLVQATDQWVAVRGSRIVLSDDTGLRAANTALWLRGMGHDVYVLDHDASREIHVTCPESKHSPPSLPVTTPGELSARLRQGAVLLDLSPGMTYRREHIQGAVWAIRPRLDRLVVAIGTDIIIASRQAEIAELAAIDLQEHGHSRISRLEGGLDDWRKAGLTIMASVDQPGENECIDFLFFVHSRHDGDLEASRRYLEWEVNLLRQVDAQELSTLNPPASPVASVHDSRT